MLILASLVLTGCVHLIVHGWNLETDTMPNQHHHRHGHNKRSVDESLAYSLTLDPDSKFLLSWTPDYENQQVHFRVDMGNSTPQSWFALGFSDRGDWAGADVCVAWEDWKGSFIVQVVVVSYFGFISTRNSEKFKYRLFGVRMLTLMDWG